jgi:hypothetical protein
MQVPPLGKTEGTSILKQMQCKYHTDRPAEFFCRTCRAPLCEECAEQVQPGVYTCFQCGMLQSVSDVQSSLADKRRKQADKKDKQRKQWGPFHYFVVVSSVLILVMWGVIIFGGQPAPERTAGFAKNERVLLFMVNGALKRYAHYSSNKYPEDLTELAPKYLSLAESDLSHLEKLSYQLDPEAGYRLSLANPRKDSLAVVLTAKGIVSIPSSGGGAE